MNIKVKLEVEIQCTGNVKNATEELQKSIMHCNCMCRSSREGESFTYKVVSVRGE